MPRFSERYGYKPIRESLQKESIDGPLLNGLWNVICHYYLDIYSPNAYGQFYGSSSNLFARLSKKIYRDFLRRPLDEMPGMYKYLRDEMKSYFFRLDWDEVYDFIEFLCEALPDEMSEPFSDSINEILEREMSAYRLVGFLVTPLTSEEEINEIEGASSLEETKFSPAAEHIRKATSKLSSRENPDYLNSIKESIAAVESVCRIATGESTLGKALKKMGDLVSPRILEAVEKLYAFTNQEEGIRHSLLSDQTEIRFEDAKFFLVMSSSVVNYFKFKIENAD